MFICFLSNNFNFFLISVFILGTPTQIYKFLAPSGSQKEKWENKLKKYIEKEKQAFVEVS